ncbi:MAG: ribosome silencing factor [Thermoleophilia bacterium]
MKNRAAASRRAAATETDKRSSITSSISSESLVQAIARAAADKKAADIVILEMKDICSYTDYFLICSGRSTRQTKAIAAGIRATIKEKGPGSPRTAGEARGDWVLLDYLSVVVHVFTPETREFYRLEVLWKEAPRIGVAE